MGEAGYWLLAGWLLAGPDAEYSALLERLLMWEALNAERAKEMPSEEGSGEFMGLLMDVLESGALDVKSPVSGRKMRVVL